MFEILHLHIPKTAGSSLLELYRRYYGEEAVLSIKRSFFIGKPEVPAHQLLQDHMHASIRVLHGHILWKEAAPLIVSPKEIKIVTFLRDPVDRVISNYFYFRHRILKGKVADHQRYRESETLLAYAALPDSRNRMSKFLDGLDYKDLFFCGTMENFNSDVRRFFHLLGITVNSIPETNKNDFFQGEREEISLKQRQVIAELNADDIQLYLWARKFQNQKK